MTHPKATHLVPLAPGACTGDPVESDLVRAATAGDRQALTELVRRHQGFVYALAQRMLYSPEDAADATQEILVRVVTNLASFRGESALRTWVYRIAVRHLLAVKKGRVEHVVHDFRCFAGALDATEDAELPDASALPVDVQLVVEEAKVGCLMAMLLCLDREHRMAFVLGELFEASDVVVADVLGISRDNARQRLARARQQLRAFLSGRCGLVQANGSCSCSRKTAGFIRQGIVDPKRLRFTDMHLDRTREASVRGTKALAGYVEEAYGALLREQPTPRAADFAGILQAILERPDVKRTLAVEN